MKKDGDFISTAQSVVDQYQTEIGGNIKKHQVIQVLKEDLGMSYRRIKPISIHANSPKNLVLRQ